MADDIQAILNKKLKPLKFERTIGLFGATTIGVGALLGAGIYVLIGSAANIAGPSVIYSYLLCGALAFVTTIMYADLSRIIPRSGGGYTYVYSILGSTGGFFTGWFLALGSILASSLYAIGFAEYAVSVSGSHLPQIYIKAIAILITILITLLNLRPEKDSKFNLQNWIVWGNVAILVLLIIVSAFHTNIDYVKPMFPKGFHGTMGAISIIYISFFGYQLIANNSDEIIEPEKTVPKAMKLSMLISILIYFLVSVTAILTVSWKELADSQAPLVLVANKSFGGNGWLIISIGGILASLGALSSTLFSQSRQAFAMGQDRFFPDSFGKLSEKTKQPVAAILVGGILVSLILASFDLEMIAKVTNFSLLLSLLPVSLALRKLYKDKPELKPKMWLKRFLPEISLLINLGLLFTMDILSLAAGQQLVIAGILIYFFYSRKREKIGREGLNIVLKEEKRFSFFNKNKVLVPMANPETQRALLLLSHVLMAKKGGEIVVLAVKEVSKNVDFYTALSESTETIEIIKKSVELGKQNNINLKPVIRASRNVAMGIVHVAEEEKCDLIVIGFPRERTDYKDSVFNKLLKTTTTDLVILNFKADFHNFKPETVGVYVKDERNLYLMLMIATAIAEKRNAKIVIFSFLPTGYSKLQKSRVDKLIRESLEHLKTTVLFNVEMYVSDDPVNDTVKLSSKFDIMVIGKDLRAQHKSVEELPSFQISLKAKCTVIMVKTVKKLDKLVNLI